MASAAGCGTGGMIGPAGAVGRRSRNPARCAPATAAGGFGGVIHAANGMAAKVRLSNASARPRVVLIGMKSMSVREDVAKILGS